MSNVIVINPFMQGGEGVLLPYDADATAYIAAVEAADGQALEKGVKVAIQKFVILCKDHGVWDAIKAACIMAGARTLAGALVPLVGAAPTNNNFVGADYDRVTGLKGDGSTKALAANYAAPTATRNNIHVSAYYSEIQTIGFGSMCFFADSANNSGTRLQTQYSRLYQDAWSENQYTHSAGAVVGFSGISRSLSTQYTHRINSINETNTADSVATTHTDFGMYAGIDDLGAFTSYSNHRATFYSIGESLDLALLDARVTTLMADIAAAIP